MNFNRDLKFGEKYEKIFLDSRKNVVSYKKINGQFKPYDLEILYENGKTIKYEVKADRQSHITGNIAIEFKCNNKDSGITATEAKYYIYYIIKDDEIIDRYKISVKKIKQFINEKKYSKIIFGGDGFKSQMYLFNKNIFEQCRKK